MAKLSEEIIDGVTVLHLSGNLTQEFAPIIEPRLEQIAMRKGARIVLNVANVESLTTPTITLFLAAMRTAKDGGGRLVFANVKGVTGDIFSRCRLDVIFTIAESLEAAVKLARE